MADRRKRAPRVALGARSKSARKVRKASEFDPSLFRAGLRAPRGTTGAYAWDLTAIRSARDAQMLGQFALAARLAESMRTDDAIFVARENRLAPQRCIKVELRAAPGTRGASVATEAGALFGPGGLAISPEALSDVNGCLADHGVAFATVTWKTREDGSRVDCAVHAWPIEYVRWDSYRRQFMARVDPELGASEVPIVHGDGRWIVFAKNEIEPFKSGAILAGAIVWARHAFAIRDWSKSSVSHGSAKMVGELPEGVPLQKDGVLSPEAAAFVELLRDLVDSDSFAGIRPANSETEFVTNNSTAWQVFAELVANGEKAAARIYNGTDGALGSQGGAPGVDVESLFGVSATIVEADLRCIERGLDSGAVEPWCAINFGDSALAPKRRYLLPDADADAARASLATRTEAFHAEFFRLKQNGFRLLQSDVDALAKKHGIDAPTLAPIAAPAAVQPAAAGAPPKLQAVP